MQDKRFGVQNNQAAYSPSNESASTGIGISDDAKKVLRNTYM